MLQTASTEIDFILSKEGKGFLVNGLKTDLTGTITLTEYYLTPFDMFLLFTHYKCPCVIASRSKIPPSNRKNLTFANLESADFIYVIFGGAWNVRNPDFKKRVPIYGILQRNGTIKLSPTYFKEFYDTENAIHVSPHGLRKKMTKGETDSFVLVDLRSEEEYTKEHIITAINIPAYKDPDTSAYDDVDRIL